MKRLKSIFLLAFFLLSFAGATSCTDENGLSSLIEVSISSDKASNIIFTGEQIALTASVEWKQEQPAGYTTTEKWGITEGKSCVDSSESADSKTLTLTGKLHSNAVKVTLTVEVINGKGKRSGSVTKDVTITIKAKLDSSAVDPNVKDFLTDDKKTAAVTYQTVPTNIISIGNDGSITVTGKGTVTVTVFDSNGNKIDEFTLDVSGHFHSYAATWSSDGTYHWKEFTCTGESDHDSNSVNPTKEKHNFGADGVCKCGKKEVPDDVIRGLFTVSDDGNGNKKKVYFSRGNLQVTRTSNGYSWDFAPKQYDCVGGREENNANRTIMKDLNWSFPENAVCDLFGWSTDSNKYVQDYGNYKMYGGYGVWFYGGTDPYYGNFVDWGETIKSKDGAKFRTMSIDEWRYIINQRGGKDLATADGWGYATIAQDKTKVDETQIAIGLVLLPDNWNQPDTVSKFVSGIAEPPDQWKTNIYDLNDWQTMEKAGAVFLPSCGWRATNGQFKDDMYADKQAGYWTSTYARKQGSYHYAWYFYFSGYDSDYPTWRGNISPDVSMTISQGYAVRLVTDAPSI